MPSYARAAIAILLFGFASLARGQALRHGFAIITPESGNPAGLIVVETILNQSFTGLVQTEVSPAPLLATAAFKVNLGTTLDDTTGIAIVNPSVFVSNVRLIITDQNGIEILNQTLAILPQSQLARFIWELAPSNIGIPAGSVGLLTLISDIPVAALVLNFRQTSFAATPVISLTSPTPVPALSSTPSTVTIPATVFPATTTLVPVTPTLPPATTNFVPTTTFTPTTVTFVSSTGIVPTATTVVPVITNPVLPTTTAFLPSTMPILPNSPVFLPSPTTAAESVFFPTTGSVVRVPTTTFLPATASVGVKLAPDPLPPITVGGTGAFILPQVANGDGWFTEITISNTSSVTQTVRIDFFDPRGLAVRSVGNILIPSRGIFFLSSLN